jgi:hypothetical protein
MTKEGGERRTRAVVAFYAIGTPIVYGYFFLIFNVLSSPYMIVFLTIVMLSFFFLFSFALLRPKPPLRQSLYTIGIRRKNLFESIFAVSLLSVLPVISQLQTVRVQGVGPLAQSLGNEGGLSLLLSSSLALSIIFFILVAIISFGFLQAFPYEILSRNHRRILNVAITTIGFVFLYGAGHIVTGSPPVIGDSLIFGFAFIVIYSYTRNSIGSMVAYVAMGEEPAWTFLALHHPSLFVLSLYGRVAWVIVSIVGLIVILFLRRVRKPRENLHQHNGT